MKRTITAGLLGVVGVLAVHPALAGVCDDLVSRMKAEGAYPSQWKGVENEVEAPDASVADRARMLSEAPFNDPGNLDVWKAFGAAERDDDIESVKVYALPKAGIGRIEIFTGGTLDCVQLGYFRVDAAGRPHVIRSISGRSGPEGDGASIVCEYDGYPHFAAADGKVFELQTTASDDATDAVTVNLWTGDSFDRQCIIDRSYDVTFAPSADQGPDSAAIAFDSDGSRFLASRADAWGRDYVAESHRQNSRVYPAGQDENKVRQADEATYRAGLVAGFTGAHGHGGEVQALIGALPAKAYNKDAARYDILPVMYKGQVAVVVVQPVAIGWRTMSDLHMWLYVMRDGRAQLEGGVVAARSLGRLSSVNIRPS